MTTVNFDSIEFLDADYLDVSGEEIQLSCLDGMDWSDRVGSDQYNPELMLLLAEAELDFD